MPTRHAWFTLGLCVAGCGSQPASVGDDAGGTADASPPRAVPTLGSSAEVCKLLSNSNMTDPTANDVQHRANVLGADLGIPVEQGGTLYFFFGDTIGFAGIWGAGESPPDSIGHALDPAADVAANPGLLCGDLRILSLAPGASIGPTVDPQVQADFAGGAMTAPAGHDLAEYIHNPAGGFANLPGDFEVPSGAFAADGAIYLFYTTVVSRADVTMKGSYLARWSAPSPGGPPAYDILYGVDERFDAAGELRGDFINIAAAAHDGYAYLFGTGLYRASPIHLARKRLDSLATAGGFERFDAATRTWMPGTTADTAPIVEPAGYGETSVQYFAAIDRWMLLAEEQGPGTNHIVARFAERPEGPWSAAIVVHDMADPAFRDRYCCVPDNACQGEQFFNCDRTGFYGSYLLPELVLHPDGSFTVSYTMSSFDRTTWRCSARRSCRELAGRVARVRRGSVSCFAMGMQTIAKVAQSFDGVFECRHCEAEITATVFAKASGAARGIDARAEALALENAEMDANALASRTLQFVRCPRCGKKDPSGPSYRIQATIGALVLGAGSAGLCYLLVTMRSRGTADADATKWVALGFGIFMALLLYWKWGRPWRSPDKRTVFR